MQNLSSLFVVHCERISKRQAYYVRFPYNVGLVEKIKNLPEETRKWNNVVLAWELNTSSLLTLIKSFKGSNRIYFDFGSDDSRKIFVSQIKKIEASEEEKRNAIVILNQNKEKWVKYKEELEKNYEQYSKRVHANLKPEVILYPHQIISTMFLNEVKNALLALDMGVGKSLISIALAEMNKFEKVFVIVPNSLKYNFYNEILKFSYSKAYIIGKKNKYSLSECRYIIVNYEYFNSSDHNKVLFKFNKLDIGKIDCLICDESHRLKNNKSHTFSNFKKIFKKNIFRNEKVCKVFMSGTPCPSKSAELYTVLNQISPLDFPTKKFFYEYYCGLKYNLDGYGWETDFTLTKFDELFHKISPFIYRKKKNEILKDLPEKTYQKIILEMSPSEYDVYEKIEEGIANEFFNKNINNPLSIMGKLREYTSHLKVNNVKELIDSILECGEKFVAVDFYKKSLIELNKQYPQVSALHTGDVSDVERAEIVKDFQDENGKIKIFLGSEQVTKEGLTLTEASKIGILTIPWTPTILDQIIDRLLRIGQKNAVNAYLFIFKNTIDEYVINLCEQKRQEISQVIDGEKYESNINESIINDLIKIIMQKHKKTKN